MQAVVANASSNMMLHEAILDLSSQNWSSHPLYALTAHLLFPWHVILMDIKSCQTLPTLTSTTSWIQYIHTETQRHKADDHIDWDSNVCSIKFVFLNSKPAAIVLVFSLHLGVTRAGSWANTLHKVKTIQGWKKICYSWYFFPLDLTGKEMLF